jgi:hypothetical protein
MSILQFFVLALAGTKLKCLHSSAIYSAVGESKLQRESKMQREKNVSQKMSFTCSSIMQFYKDSILHYVNMYN